MSYSVKVYSRPEREGPWTYLGSYGSDFRPDEYNNILKEAYSEVLGASRFVLFVLDGEVIVDHDRKHWIQ